MPGISTGSMKVASSADLPIKASRVSAIAVNVPMTVAQNAESSASGSVTRNSAST